MSQFKIVLASDHHGVVAKHLIAEHLRSLGYEVDDFGTDSRDPVDYPEYGRKVADVVSASPDKTRGILLCGTGIGMCMVANRVKHVFAGQVWNEALAARAASEDKVNVLCIASDYIQPEDAITLVDVWLKTPFSGLSRHEKRLRQLE